jgi:hypothetical protein
MVNDGDTEIKCRTCGNTFTFTAAELEFYELKGFTMPSHCKACRQMIEYKKQAKEGTDKLKAAELSLAEMSELIVEKDHQISELTFEVKNLTEKVDMLSQRIGELSKDLEKARQIDSKLSFIHSIVSTFENRLENVVETQNFISQRILDVVKLVQEVFNRTSLWEIIKYKLRTIFKQDVNSLAR